MHPSLQDHISPAESTAVVDILPNSLQWPITSRTHTFTAFPAPNHNLPHMLTCWSPRKMPARRTVCERALGGTASVPSHGCMPSVPITASTASCVMQQAGQTGQIGTGYSQVGSTASRGSDRARCRKQHTVCKRSTTCDAPAIPAGHQHTLRAPTPTPDPLLRCCNTVSCFQPTATLRLQRCDAPAGPRAAPGHSRLLFRCWRPAPPSPCGSW